MPLDEDILNVPTKGEELDKLAAQLAGPIEKLMQGFMAEHEKGQSERDSVMLERLSKEIDEKVSVANEEIIKTERKFDVAGAEDGDDGRRKGEKFSISRFARAIAKKDWSLAPFEREVNVELHKAMETDTDSAGGYLVPEFYSSSIIKKLRADTVAVQLGATEITSAKGFPIKIPRLKTDVTGYWVAEGSSITASQPVIDQIMLTPRTLAGRTILSNLLIENSAPTADAIVNDSIAAQLALGLDNAILQGSGNDQPVGLLNVVTATEAFTSTTMFVDLNACIKRIAGENALKGNLGWAMHPDCLYGIQQYAGGTGDPDVSRRLLTEGPPQNIMGYKFATTTQLPKPNGTLDGSLIFGNWAEVLIGRWSNLVISASDTTSDAFEKDQIHVRGLLRADTNIAHIESFIYSLNFPA